MKGLLTILAFASAACLTASELDGFDDERSSPEPKEVIKKVLAAVGDHQEIRKKKTIHNEGTVEMVNSGMKGTFKEWIEKPKYRRIETIINGMKVINGNNREYSWFVDFNGKRQINRKENSVKKDKYHAILNILNFCLEKPSFFPVSYEGHMTINGKDCHVLKISVYDSNTVYLNVDADTHYIRRTEVVDANGRREACSFSDYRKVGNLVYPFRVETSSSLSKSVVRRVYTKREMDISLPDKIFDVPEDVRDFTFVNGKSQAEVPFIYLNNLIYVPVVINGREKLWLLDTGASSSIIHQNYAKQLKLTSKGRVKLMTVKSTIDAEFVELPAFKVKDLEFGRQYIAAVKLDGKHQKNEVGVLGYDFLSRFVTRIDYGKRVLTFYDREKFKYEGKGSNVKIENRMGLLLVSMSIDDKLRGKWLIDTGASETMFFSDYDEVFFVDLSSRITPHGFVVGTNGQSINIARVSFKFLKIGDYQVDKPEVLVPLEKQGRTLQGNVIGHIGNTLLSNFIVYLDYNKPLMILEK